MKKYLVILMIVIVVASCAKDQPLETFGCKDINAANNDVNANFHDSTCSYLYVTEYELYKYENKTWDPLFDDLFVKDNADIKIEISATDDFSVLQFGSNDIEDADPDSSHFWTAPDQFRLTNTTWYWRMHDDDDLSFTDGDDFMDQGTFNAVKNGNGIYVEGTSDNGQTKIRIYYDVR